MEKILVIKLSALGDFILALGPMEAIRRQHKDAHIALLTTQPFVDIAERSGYFNEIIIDARPKLYELHLWYSLYKILNAGNFTRVYDLQLNKRSARYYKLFRHKPDWSGVVPGSPLFYANTDARQLHAFKRHQEILKVAGIDAQLPDLSWMVSDITAFGIKNPYVLLVPGSAPQHPAKRWPAKYYTTLAMRLARDGCQPVILGTAIETEVAQRITKLCSEALDLTGRTSLYDIATLARGAKGAIGNDTGPMHLIAQAGCPVVTLFCTTESNAARSAPIGRSVQVIEAQNLEDISMSEVYKKFDPGAAA
jgi:ADP-heptose:LPS heptosyltransferase